MTPCPMRKSRSAISTAACQLGPRAGAGKRFNPAIKGAFKLGVEVVGGHFTPRFASSSFN